MTNEELKLILEKIEKDSEKAIKEYEEYNSKFKEKVAEILALL